MLHLNTAMRKKKREKAGETLSQAASSAEYGPWIMQAELKCFFLRFVFFPIRNCVSLQWLGQNKKWQMIKTANERLSYLCVNAHRRQNNVFINVDGMWRKNSQLRCKHNLHIRLDALEFLIFKLISCHQCTYIIFHIHTQ